MKKECRCLGGKEAHGKYATDRVTGERIVVLYHKACGGTLNRINGQVPDQDDGEPSGEG